MNTGLSSSFMWGEINLKGESPHGVVTKVLDCGIEVNEFEFQSRYYVHFRNNALKKGMKPIIPHTVG